MAIKYTNIVICKTLQNLPKLGVLGLEIRHLATLVTTGDRVSRLQLRENKIVTGCLIRKCKKYGKAQKKAS
jgi:hypothetical protein